MTQNTTPMIIAGNALAKTKENYLGLSRLRSFNPADAKSSFHSAHINYDKDRSEEGIR